MRARGVRLFAAGVVAALFCGAPLPAAGADPYREVSLALGEGLLALFPAVEGYVVSASGGEAYVDLARKDLVKPGMELQVYRPGAEMIHPVTKQVLGSYEKDLGVLSVTEVREKYSRGALDAAGAAAGIVAGDRVRLSARRLRTLLHVAGAAAGIEIGPLAQALIARGEQSGRFAMIDEPGWAPSLAALGAPWETVRADPALLRRLGELAAADLLLLARIEPGAPPRRGRGALAAHRDDAGRIERALAGACSGDPRRLPSPRRRHRRAAAPAPATAAPAAATGWRAAGARRGRRRPGASPRRVHRARTGRAREVPGRRQHPRRGAARGGADRRRAALALPLGGAGARLALGRGRPGRQAHPLSRCRRSRRGRPVGSPRDGGRAREGHLRAAALAGQRLRVAATIDGVYLRAAPRAGAPPLLLGQRAGIGEVLTGRVEQYRLRAGSFERVEGSALPGGVGIFGLALAPAGGPVALYRLDRAGYISGLTPTGAVAWRSARPYGGYPPPLTAVELFGLRRRGSGLRREARAFQGRLLAERAPGASGSRSRRISAIRR